ncbi:poly(A) RNA polymerase GLD2-B-like [Amphiura filiformis]|uniref:poly(A) RNA polymerase GLD2-B-like n=1 Tax=Amphiura filiformis TaxID=82378 RepID=UPI003B20F9B2
MSLPNILVWDYFVITFLFPKTKPLDTEGRTSSPSLDDKIALAVTDSYSSSKASVKVELKVPQVNRPQKTSEKRTSNSVSSETGERNTSDNLKPSSSSSSSRVDSLTPPPGTSSANKRKAGVASLTNSAPPAVKVKHSKREATEQNSTPGLDTPTSSKQYQNSQRRNSLPAKVHDTLAEQILSRYQETKQQDHDLRRKEVMRVQLENVIHEVMPYFMIIEMNVMFYFRHHVVFSWFHQELFWHQSSDADMCLMVTDGDMNQKRDAKNILYQLKDYLRDRCSFMRRLQVIPAKVPIIKFTHKFSGLECDLNINNATGIRNTHLLQTYAKLDQRVAPLVLIIKQWASQCGINDASQGTLSSYSWVLMVLNYLQVRCDPPVLPALQQKYSSTFSQFSNVRQFHGIDPSSPLPSHINYQSQNKQDVGTLLRGFFEYYANEFDFSSGVMCVRMGKVLHLNQVRMNGGDWLGKYIFIEEPFDMTNTARAVYKIEKFMVIRKEIRYINAKFMRHGPDVKISRILDK